VGFLAEAVLYADLRDRLREQADLVDLSGADLRGVAEAVPTLDVLLHHPRLPLTADVIGVGTRLRAVLAPGAGYDGIPLAVAAARGILVTNQAGCNDEAVAEHVIGLVLAVAKRIGEGDRRIRSGHGWQPAMYLNHEIRGLTMGIIGLGAIGRRLAAIAMTGFGMDVLAYDPYVSEAQSGVALAPLDEVLTSADVVSVNTPLTDTTRNLIGARERALMKPSAILVNTARGHIVDQAALSEALRNGRLRGAGLDVFDDDVLEPGDSILDVANVVVTPHIAGATVESLASQAVRQADAVRAVLRGEVPKTANVLDPSAAERFLERFGPVHASATGRENQA
jgi:D-3-phosphoglycerate dehydrogenase